MYGIYSSTLYLGKSNNGTRFLALVLASLFLASLGVISHDAFADTVIDHIQVPNELWSIGVNSNTNMIYVGYYHNNTISVINGTTDTIVKTIPVGASTWAIAVNPVTNKIYASDYLNGPVFVIDGSTDTVIDKIQIAAAGIAVNQNTNKVYVANGSSLYVIDGSTDTVTDKVLGNSFSYTVVNPNTNKVYSGNWAGTRSDPNTAIFVIDGNNNNVTAKIRALPGGIAVNPNTNKIYWENGYLWAIDGATNTETLVSNSASCVGVNPTTNKIYTCDSGSNGLVNVLNGTNYNKIQTLTGFTTADWMGVNPTTSRIYVTDPFGYQVEVIDGNPTPMSKLTVKSQDNNGNTITGFYTVLSKNGNMMSTGFTPASFTLNDSQTYTVHVGDFGKFIFNYWSDTGSTSATRDISITSDDNITAVYKTIPQSPTELMATAASSSQISLSWTAPGDNGGSAVTGYVIERSADNGSTWSTIVTNTGNDGTTYSDTGLQSNSTYTYRVSTINSVGTSAPSNTASATTPIPTVGGTNVGDSSSSGGSSTSVTLDNVQSTSGTTSASNQITISGFNAGTGSNQLLLVGISANNNSPVSVTFNGVQLTQAVGSFYNNDAEFWYLKNPTGTGDITVTMGGPTQAVVGAYSFSGVNQTDPIPTNVARHNTTPNSPNVSITTKYPNDLVLDLPSIYGDSTLGSPTCTQQWDVNVPSAISGASSSTVISSPAAVSCKWTASSADFWDDVAVELKAN